MAGGARVEEAIEGGAQVVAVDRPHRLAQPGRVDQRLGRIAAHDASQVVSWSSTLSSTLLPACAATIIKAHRRAAAAIVRVVLRGAHAGHVVVVAVEDQLVDALLAERRVPVVGEEMRVAARHDARIGRAEAPARLIDEARQVLELEVALPVVGGVPARHRHAASDPVGAVAHRHAARRDQADVAVGVGDHHALHRHDVLAHALDVVGDAARAAVEHAGGDGRVVVAERGPLQRRHVALAQHAVEVAVEARQHRPVPRAPALDVAHADALDGDRHLGRSRRRASRRASGTGWGCRD